MGLLTLADAEPFAPLASLSFGVSACDACEVGKKQDKMGLQI